MSVDRFVQTGFWLLAFPFMLALGCIAFGLYGVIRFLFPYGILLGSAIHLTSDHDGKFYTLDAIAALAISVILLQILSYGLIIILTRNRIRTIVLLSAVHVVVYLATFLVTGR